MQGVRPTEDGSLRHSQAWPSAQGPSADENAHAQHRGKPADRAVSFLEPQGLGSVRKALSGMPPLAALHGKTPKTVLGRRRALGDITNATPARGLAAGLQGTAAKTAPRPEVAERAAAHRQRSISQAQIEAWAEEGVEGRAGKSWAMLEAERHSRNDADIAAGVDATLRFLAFQEPYFGRDATATMSVPGTWDGEPEATLSGRSSPADCASPAMSETRRVADDLAAAIAALPVLESRSPIRAWQLDELQEEEGDNRYT